MSWLCAVGAAGVLAGVFDSCAAVVALVVVAPALCAATGFVSWLAAGDRLGPVWAGFLAATTAGAPELGAVAICAVAPGLVDGAASTGADVDGAGDVA